MLRRERTKKLFIYIGKFLLLFNFTFFSLGTFLARLRWEKSSLKLLQIGAKTDLGICNLAEYQLGGIFRNYLNYGVAVKYYLKAARSPLSCVRKRAYYNIGVIYSDLGYGSLNKKEFFRTLDQWIVSLGAFKLAYKHGERSEAKGIKPMRYNISKLQEYMYKNCVNVCHVNCSSDICKRSNTSRNRRNSDNSKNAKPKKDVDAQKIREIERRQVKAIKERQRRASSKRWLDRSKKGDYTQGW